MSNMIRAPAISFVLNTPRRLSVLASVAALVMLIIGGRFFQLNIIQHQAYQRFITSEELNVNLTPLRGDIFFENKDGKLVSGALTKKAPFLYAIPRNVPDPEAYAEVLESILGVARDDLRAKLAKSNDPYELLKRYLTDEQMLAIEDLALEGVFIGEEERRFYPKKETASHVLGFVRNDDAPQGQYGIEQSFQQKLSSAGESNVPQFLNHFRRPKQATDVVIAIEPQVQEFVERQIQEAKEKWQAEQAFFVVLDPKTGKILAMGAEPSFDPNTYHSVKDITTFLNPVTSNVFEVGSVMKAITLAAALDQGVITPQTTYYDYGWVKVKDRVIENFDRKERGVQTMTQVLEQSLNTGAIFAMQRLGKENFRSYLKQFGLHEKTSIELPGEVSGNIDGLSDANREVEFATASFGQGIAVTPLAFARAIGVLANDGKLMQPYIVSYLLKEGEVRYETAPQVVRQVIKPDTALNITRMLVDVVEHTLAGGKLKMSGYSIAAKTGTAQLPRSDAKGYSDDLLHTFFGYFPAFDAKAVVFLGLVKPKGVRYASQSLADAFGEITRFIINYYRIPPDNLPQQDQPLP